MSTLFGKKLIKSTSYSNDEIIMDIMTLYGIERFDLDCTYSKGVFWKNLPQPIHKTDLNPQTHDTKKSCSTDLPFQAKELKSIMFDPPFLVGYSPKKGKMTKRFSAYRTMKDLIEHYEKSLIEFYRILDQNGFLVFKCQDTVSGGKQYFTHKTVIDLAEETGFYPIDLFVLISKSRMIGGNHKRQFHARKFHSYFLVFKKK